MSIVGSLKREMEDDYFALTKHLKESGIDENAKIRGYLDSNKDQNDDWQCGLLSQEPFDAIDWAKQEVRYRMHSKWADTFPHYTTTDQSFYNDQQISYIGLGYEQAMRSALIYKTMAQ